MHVLSWSTLLLLRCALTPGSGPGLAAWVAMAFMTSKVASRDLATCCDLWPLIEDVWVSRLLTHVYRARPSPGQQTTTLGCLSVNKNYSRGTSST